MLQRSLNIVLEVQKHLLFYPLRGFFSLYNFIILPLLLILVTNFNFLEDTIIPTILYYAGCYFAGKIKWTQDEYLIELENRTIAENEEIRQYNLRKAREQ